MPSEPSSATGQQQPISEDDAFLAGAVRESAVAALLPALAQVTGDMTLLRDDLRPDPSRALEPEGGLSEQQLEEMRELATAALVRYRDAGSPVAGAPSDDDLRRMMAFLFGDENVFGGNTFAGEKVDSYFGVLREELAPAGEDVRAPGWRLPEIAPGVDFCVAVVGAGMSGILAAYRLRQAGIPFVVFEKNDDVGGTWFENTYPGCRVDVPNNLYSYACAQATWSHHFSAQETLLDYFRRCADDFGVRDSIRFRTEVVSAVFDDEACTWRLQIRLPDGSDDTVEVNALVSAVGQLNRPHYPEIAGVDEFAGAAFHSARWDRSVDLRGKRVAVIGTGASAAQFIPVVAEDVAHLTVFQRTPNWLAPTPEYHDEVPAGMRWLFDRVPSYAQWYRLWLFWRMHEGLLPAARVDPEWELQHQSVSAPNELVRQLLTVYLQMEFGDRPDLLGKVVPSYPPIAKRIIRDNGVWARTLKRDNVELVTDRIERIAASGVVTVDDSDESDGGGAERRTHEADVIIYGTGFLASHFLTPMRVTGRGGVDLHERWAGDARAYLGITVPEFPNLFCLYGPNTNIVINGSIIYFSECEVRYVLESLRMLLAGGHRAMNCRKDVHDAFNERIDAENRRMAWGASSVNSWYKNEHGRVAQNWPFSLLEYWRQTLHPDPDDYELV
ncbi:MAG TPA: NAD(P)/FAD-dependent oxidoreductase [Acidimicrobiales bacterium]